MRQSNIELGRIISILLVLLVHSSFATFGNPVKWDTPYFGLIFAQSIGVVGVNVFVLISGYFSIRLKKKSVIKLLFCCFFYAIISIVYSVYSHSFSLYQLFFISDANWFVSGYLGLMLLSPILNSYVEQSTQRTLGRIIIVLLLFQIWYEFIPKFIPDFYGGYSIMSFCILYILARYLYLYPVKRIGWKMCLTVYLITTFILAILIWYLVVFNIKGMSLITGLLKYNSPLVILAAVGLFLSFEKIKIPYSPIINHLAKSCLAVLLIHTSISFFPLYSEVFLFVFEHTSGILLVCCWLLAIVLIYLACVAIDQVRLMLERRIL